MKNNKQVAPAPDWDAIFKRRPDLQPPGYIETCEAIRRSNQENLNGKVS